MKQLAVKIDPFLFSVLKKESFNNFTVTLLRDEYLAELGPNHDSTDAGKFIYRQILRFVRLGLLKKESAKNIRESKYSKTSKFAQTKFENRSIHQAKKANTTITSVSNNENGNKLDSALNKIEEQLKQYNVDLLASVGESEEYMRLYKSNHEFKTLLETQYHQAREQSSKLLGQIKALNTVINHFSR